MRPPLRPLLPALLWVCLATPSVAWAQEYVIWQSPLSIVANEPDVTIIPGIPRVAVELRFTNPGTRFVVIPLTVPSNVYVRKATVCYDNTSGLTYIERISILDVTTPDLSASPIVEVIDLDITDASCPTTTAASVPPNWSPPGSVAIQLQLNVDDVEGRIEIGAVGLHVEPTSGSAPDRIGD